MKCRYLSYLAVAVILFFNQGPAFALDLEYHKLYKITPGMSAEDIMQIQYFNQFTKFANDYQQEGYVYLIESNGSVRQRSSVRKRIVLGKGNIAYKDFTAYTGPTSVKGLTILSWTYMKYGQDPDQWLWIPSLKKVRKISASQADDSFLGSDFTTEEITTRSFEDETYKLIGEESFKGFTSGFNKKAYKQGADCFIIEAKPKRNPWYYTRRVVWVEKATAGDIYQEIYDATGRMYKTIFKNYEIMPVDGKEYPTQTYLECKDLRTNHTTVIENNDIKLDQGVEERELSEKVLERSKWQN
ncbi:MAG: outer membrane lipoprotein-sorting protein [Candidatus Omnitrophota bacterium]